MTWFNPNVYCKQNLKEKDRKELDYWDGVVKNTIDYAADIHGENDTEDILSQIRASVVGAFVKELKSQWADKLNEQIVACIDSYEGEVESVEEPELYEADDFEDDEDE